MALALLTMFIRLQIAATESIEGFASRHIRARRFGDDGQATTEYALVLLAAALVGLLVVAWATAGGGAERVARLFNKVIDSAIDRV
ncbi:MAG: hypothetical protein ABWZ42_02735 [Ilumatobacteraceae bacterium]